MAVSHVFSIEAGEFGLALVGDTDPSDWQTPGGVTVDVVDIAAYSDFSCQVTSGALTASANTSDDVTPATFCQAEITTTKVGVTSYTVDVSFLQDPDVVAGLNRYLFENDTLLAYFYLGLAGGSPPKMVGRCRLIAGTIGGEARVTLTADLSLPCERKPDVEFGDATLSEVVEGVRRVWATSFAAGSPGTITPADANEPNTLAELTAAAPPVAASPTTAWPVGQYVQLPGTNDLAGRVTWDGAAWIAAPVTITSMTAGTPGTFAPPTATEPTTLAEINAANPPIPASPTAAWATGESVALPGGTAVHWDGTAYAVGVAPLAAPGGQTAGSGSTGSR